MYISHSHFTWEKEKFAIDGSSRLYNGNQEQLLKLVFAFWQNCAAFSVTDNKEIFELHLPCLLLCGISSFLPAWLTRSALPNVPSALPSICSQWRVHSCTWMSLPTAARQLSTPWQPLLSVTSLSGEFLWAVGGWYDYPSLHTTIAGLKWASKIHGPLYASKATEIQCLTQVWVGVKGRPLNVTYLN